MINRDQYNSHFDIRKKNKTHRPFILKTLKIYPNQNISQSVCYPAVCVCICMYVSMCVICIINGSMIDESCEMLMGDGPGGWAQ